MLLDCAAGRAFVSFTCHSRILRLLARRFRPCGLSLRLICGFSLRRFTFCFAFRLLALLTGGDDSLRGREDRVRFVERHVEVFNQIVNVRLRQRVYVFDAVLSERRRHGSRHTFERRERHRCARSDERAHLFGDLFLQLFLAADVYVPTDELRRQTHVLPALADGQ